ncbi:MAG: hypothetical protein ACNA8J_03205 [Gammaproteobacteria bacterium]
MTLRTLLVLTGTLAAVLAASVFFMARSHGRVDPMLLHTDGVGLLRLGQDYQESATAAARLAPDTAFAGLGCGGLDEIRYSGHLAQLPVTVMAMAEDGHLIEIEASVDAPLQTVDEAACLALRDQFAAVFLARFGTPSATWTVAKPVSREHMLRSGPVVIVARWFRTGGSCYISAHYGYRDRE